MGPQAHLRLEPGSSRGWFGGRRIAATGAVHASEKVSLADAAQSLQDAFEGREGLTAVLAAYNGTCTVLRFSDYEDASVRERTVVEPDQDAAPLLRQARWDTSARAYRRAIATARERIAAGDVYVLNLTAQLSGILATAPEPAFEELLSRASGDMSAYADGLPGATPWIASVSPERFLRVTQGTGGARLVEVCPIKGTRPRGLTPEVDRLLAADLTSDEKELAEHLMVVDLERNDIGVVCAPGTVHVDPLYGVVETPYCHQLVSTVRGTLAASSSFAELLASAFPCGSVTGAPKLAAMRIIGELEASPRGAYCGALIVAIPGELDSSVLIRTLEGSADEPGAATWGAGCGITYESEASAEHLELLLKASPVLGDRPPATALRETMRVVAGRVPLLQRHLERLAVGGCGPTTLARVRAAVEVELAAADVAAPFLRLGVTVTPDGGVATGLSDQSSTLSVPGGPVAVPVEIAELPELPTGAAKPASRRFWDRAHHRADLAGAHQAVLHQPDGTLIDGSTANVWLIRDGVLLTPPAPPAVAGVARELVFDLARQLGIEACERVLTLHDLETADEVALSNAVGGFVSVRGRGGPIVARMSEAVERAFANDCSPSSSR